MKKNKETKRNIKIVTTVLKGIVINKNIILKKS